jgi:Fic family protein
MFENVIEKIEKLKEERAPFRSFEGERLALLKEYYRIGAAYASNALEGNTLTESETKMVIEDGLTVGGKTLREHLEAVGHA